MVKSCSGENGMTKGSEETSLADRKIRGLGGWQFQNNCRGLEMDAHGYICVSSPVSFKGSTGGRNRNPGKILETWIAKNMCEKVLKREMAVFNKKILFSMHTLCSVLLTRAVSDL